MMMTIAMIAPVDMITSRRGRIAHPTPPVMPG
jgi:hypothetical protein